MNRLYSYLKDHISWSELDLLHHARHFTFLQKNRIPHKRCVNHAHNYIWYLAEVWLTIPNSILDSALNILNILILTIHHLLLHSYHITHKSVVAQRPKNLLGAGSQFQSAL